MLLIRFALGGLIFLGVYAFERFVDHAYNPSTPRLWRDVGEATMVVATGLFALELGLAASRIFGDEKRAVTLGSLVVLPRSTGWLIRQKLLGCIAIIIPSVALFLVGLWIYLGSRTRSHFHLQNIRQDEWLALFYTASQALLLPILIAHLSLRIRRGALPAGIAVATALNVITATMLEVCGNRINDDVFVGIMTALSVTAAIVLASMTFKAIPRAAAEE
jgi:lipopolysaccharide export LptBFGC system permease protein LptF